MLARVGMAGPLFLKQAVDVLSTGTADALAGAVRAVVTFGLCGVVQHLSKVRPALVVQLK